MRCRRSVDRVHWGKPAAPGPGVTRSLSDSMESTTPYPRAVTPIAPGDKVVVVGAGPAGLTAAYLLANMTSSLSPTNSAARPGRRSNLPSAHRVSYATFRPSS